MILNKKALPCVAFPKLGTCAVPSFHSSLFGHCSYPSYYGPFYSSLSSLVVVLLRDTTHLILLLYMTSLLKQLERFK